VLRTSGDLTGAQRWGLILGLAIIVIGLLSAYETNQRREVEREDARHEVVPDTVDPFEGGYPVPPLPGQTVVRTAGPTALGTDGDGTPRAVTVGAANDTDSEEVRGG
jgi:NADH-quinone oxidoreductase subunit H